MKIEGKEGDWELFTGSATSLSNDEFLILVKKPKSEEYESRYEFSKSLIQICTGDGKIDSFAGLSKLLFDTFERKKSK